MTGTRKYQLTATFLVTQLRQAGLNIYLGTDGQIAVEGPRQVVTRYRHKIAQYEDSIRQYLQEERRPLASADYQRKLQQFRREVYARLWFSHCRRCESCRPGKPTCSVGKRLWSAYRQASVPIPVEFPDIDQTIWNRGVALLYNLWNAGFGIEVKRKPTGELLLIPIDQQLANEDLFAQYERDHDAAATVLAFVCRSAGIDPIEWQHVSRQLGRESKLR